MLKTWIGIFLGVSICVQNMYASDDSLKVHELISKFEAILYN